MPNIIYSLTFLLFYSSLYSQNIKILEIEKSIDLLEINSEEFKQINRNLKIDTLRYKIYKNIFLPKVNLSLSIPSYNKSINSITLPNGDNKFIEQSQTNSNSIITITQPITLTGGDITVNSSINRIDNLSNKTSSYSSNWFNVTLNQPINGFNQYKWYKKINEAQFKKSKIDLLKSIENQKKIFIGDYFDAYINQYKIELTKRNIEITSNYLKETELLFEKGRILKTEVLKTKLYLNQLKFNLNTDILNHRIAINTIKNKLGFSENDSLILVEPKKILKPEIDNSILRERMLKYSLNYDFELDLIESAQKLAKIKSARGIQFSLQTGYGLNSRAEFFNELYEIPSRKEFVNFGLTIPLINWKENSRLHEIQKLSYDNLKSERLIKEKELNISLISYLNYFESVYFEINSWKENSEIAKLNTDISTQLLKTNRITINDFSQELFKEEKLIIDYYYSLKSLWEFKFTIRKNRLFDFFENIELYK